MITKHFYQRAFDPQGAKVDRLALATPRLHRSAHANESCFPPAISSSKQGWVGTRNKEQCGSKRRTPCLKTRTRVRVIAAIQSHCQRGFRSLLYLPALACLLHSSPRKYKGILGLDTALFLTVLQTFNVPCLSRRCPRSRWLELAGSWTRSWHQSCPVSVYSIEKSMTRAAFTDQGKQINSFSFGRYIFGRYRWFTQNKQCFMSWLISQIQRQFP